MRHIYQSIPGWFSFGKVYADAVHEAPAFQPSIFVEIGAWKGKSTSFMGVEIANSKKPISFYTVDHFLGSDEAVHKADPDIQAGTLFQTFQNNIRPVAGYVKVFKMASREAARKFDDKTIDFLFIDGGHNYDDVASDLDLWFPKMKPDGVVAGDDYNWSGVKQAIHEFFEPKYQINILGEGKGRHWRVRLNG